MPALMRITGYCQLAIDCRIKDAGHGISMFRDIDIHTVAADRTIFRIEERCALFM